ncbi:MAG: hypothetical protein R3268_09260 [Acidiferrobacterales bacterium]|nr:hypothetical protein [Acidiferrobacterales bacterium]
MPRLFAKRSKRCPNCHRKLSSVFSRWKITLIVIEESSFFLGLALLAFANGTVAKIGGVLLVSSFFLFPWAGSGIENIWRCKRCGDVFDDSDLIKALFAFSSIKNLTEPTDFFVVLPSILAHQTLSD